MLFVGWEVGLGCARARLEAVEIGRCQGARARTQLSFESSWEICCLTTTRFSRAEGVLS